jgi:hypothetical protein
MVEVVASDKRGRDPNSGFQMATRDMNLTKMTVKRPQTVNTVNTLRSLQDHD